jgi:hypothetical protein
MIERKFNERLLLDFKENGGELLFEDVMKDKDLKKYVYYVCHQKMRSYPSTLMSFEDFTNIGYLVIWQCIQNFKFICPVCGIQTKTETMYKLHTNSKHGKFIEPEKSISEYIKFNLGAYLQNELRKEYSSSRKSNIMTEAIFSPEDNEEDDFIGGVKEFEISGISMEDDIIFKSCINELISMFDNVTKDIFIYLYKHKLKQIEIAKILFEQNRYASEQSAAVVISRTLKNKIYPIVREFFK